ILLDNVTITGTEGIFLAAGNDVLNGPATLDGGMIGVFAGNNIDLSLSDIFVGSNSDASRLPGDPLVTDFLKANGITVPSDNPNALFLAGNSVNLGNLDMSGHYLWVEANSVSFTGSVNTPQNVLVQLLPADPTLTIGVEDQFAELQQVNFGNLEHFSVFSGTTIAVGASFHLGDINIGELGAIDVGSKNMLFVNQNGNITGLDQVISTGLVALLSLAPVTDQLQEIVDTIDSVDDLVDSGGDPNDDEDDEEEEEIAGADDGDEGGDEGGLIERDEGGDETLECA
ncbi:MAG: hypothetical protein VW985_05350, partial [Gammaproteobacteria bacterium]